MERSSSWRVQSRSANQENTRPVRMIKLRYLTAKPASDQSAWCVLLLGQRNQERRSEVGVQI